MEVAEELEKNGFDADDDIFTSGSALIAVEDAQNGTDSEMGRQAILKLMSIVDSHIDEPERDKEKPFLMPVEDVFTITGRGTVATGRIERGEINQGDKVEIIGLREKQDTTITGIEMFRKILTTVKQVIMLVFFFVVSIEKTSSVVRLSLSLVLYKHTLNSNAKSLY